MGRIQPSKTYSYCKTLREYVMSTSTAQRSRKRSYFYCMKGSPGVGLFRNFIRNILPASPQNLCLVLTADSDVMTKSYADSEHDHQAEEQQAPCVLHTQSCQRLLALVFYVLIKAAAVNGCSLPCPLASRYLNTYNQGGGGVLLKSSIPACPSTFFYSSKEVRFFFMENPRSETCLL